MGTDGKKKATYKLFFGAITAITFGVALLLVSTKQNKETVTDQRREYNNSQIVNNNSAPIDITGNENQMEAKNSGTLIVNYNPLPDANASYQHYEGSCQAGSVYSRRQDIYSCKSDEIDFDACFKLKKENLFFCGVNPVDQESGVILKATGSLPPLDGKDAGQNELILIELENGGNCAPMGKVNLTVDAIKAKYQCGNGTVIFDEPIEKDGKLMVSISKLIETESHSWKIESTIVTKAAKAWK